MSIPTHEELTRWFGAADRSWDWQMIAACDRDLLDALALHWHLARIAAGEPLPVVTESVEDEYFTEHLLGLTLGAVQLSFADSDLGTGKVQVAMDFTDGLLMSEMHASGTLAHIVRVGQVLPFGDARLTFELPFASLSGRLDGQAVVLLDPAQGEDFRFTSMRSDLSELQVGARFKAVFSRLPEALRQTVLARVSRHQAAPRTLFLRGMAKPGGEGGALLMLVNFDNAFDGKVPGQDFPYPVPDGGLMFPGMVQTLMHFGVPWDSVHGNELVLGEHLQSRVWTSSYTGQFEQRIDLCAVRPRPGYFTLQPASPFMLAGGSQSFLTEPPTPGVSWRVSAAVPGQGDPGTISNDGVYSAPPAEALAGACQTVVISAEADVAGRIHRASAQVAILRSSVSAATLFEVCGLGESVTLAARTPPGDPEPHWELRDPVRGGTLSVGEGRQCIYTAGEPEADRSLYVEVIEVSHPLTREVTLIHVLVLATPLNLAFFVSADSQPETGAVQLQVMTRNGPVDLGDLPRHTLEIHGYAGGVVDERGIYRAPADARGLVLLHVTVPGGLAELNGFLVLLLPLQAHPGTLRQVGGSLQRRVGPSASSQE